MAATKNNQTSTVLFTQAGRQALCRRWQTLKFEPPLRANADGFHLSGDSEKIPDSDALSSFEGNMLVKGMNAINRAHEIANDRLGRGLGILA